LGLVKHPTSIVNHVLHVINMPSENSAYGIIGGSHMISKGLIQSGVEIIGAETSLCLISPKLIDTLHQS